MTGSSGSDPSPTSAPRQVDDIALPATVSVDLQEPVGAYYRRRLAQHTGDWYCGIRLQKLPEDLRAYEHLIWAGRPSAIIELGCHRGGSTLWLRDRLAAMARYRPTAPAPLVIGVSLDTAPAREGVALRDPAYSDSIVFVDGSVLDPEVAEHVAALLPQGASCLVIEDTAHQYDTTTAALRHYSRFVGPGGYFVVEDGVVDVPQLADASMGSGGVLRAVAEWLDTEAAAEFVLRRDLELYGLTSSPHGWLQRRP